VKPEGKERRKSFPNAKEAFSRKKQGRSSTKEKLAHTPLPLLGRGTYLPKWGRGREWRGKVQLQSSFISERRVFLLRKKRATENKYKSLPP